MTTEIKLEDTKALLIKFCDDIDVCGGVTINEDGKETLVGDDWPDLADSYLKACELLGRQPKWEEWAVSRRDS
jgi:hypothetical protein